MARALGGAAQRAASPSLHLGAVGHGGDAGAGSAPFVRGFAWLGVGSGCSVGGGGVGGGGVGETRGLSSSSAALSASSLSDKIAAAHAAATRAARDNEHLTPGEKAARGEGVGDRAAGGATPGEWAGYGAVTRGGGRRGGGGRGGGGSRAHPTPEALRNAAAEGLNNRIAQETHSEGLLQLVADELHKLNAVTVSKAFCRLGKLRESRHLADDRFRGLMVRVREMCVDGQLQLSEMFDIMHAVAKMRAAGKVATDEPGVDDMLAALEQRVVLLAPTMNRSHVPYTILALSALGRPGATAWAAMEAAVVRVAPSMH